MITVSITGCIDSETKACSGWLCSGRRSPAMRASTDECPAATPPTRSALTGPRLGCDGRDGLGLGGREVGLQRADPPALDVHAGDLAALDQVHPQPACGTGEAARHRIVVRHPGARLPTGPHHPAPAPPSRLAARAKPRATASWCATPARGCQLAPSTG